MRETKSTTIHMQLDYSIKVFYRIKLDFSVELTRFSTFAEIHTAKANGKPFRDNRYVDVYREKSLKVVVKVIVPVKEYPKVRSCNY